MDRCALILATLAAHGRDLGFGFTGLDDPVYVTANPWVQRGLTLRGLAWACTSLEGANWHPLTWLSLMLDAEIGGGSPAVFHATNVALHLANTLLLFALVLRWSRLPGRSGVVAALFALHPLHVESVAWVSERKDLLAGAFWFLTLLAYTRWTERPGWRRYVLVLAAFAAGLASKPMVVSLPLVLLLVDAWPLARLSWNHLAEKLLLAVLAAVVSAVTLVAQARGGAIGSLEAYPLWARAANAVQAAAIYLRQMLWPAGLAVLYPHPGETISLLSVAAALLVLACLSIVALRQTRARPYLAVGWLWYLVTLLPVIGIVQVGLQAHADRYTYIPLVGIFLALVWLVADLARGRAPVVLAAGTLVVLAGLGSATWLQSGHWRDRHALFARLAEAVPDYDAAHNTLGTILLTEGAVEEAMQQFSRALELNPRHAGAQNNLGLALLLAGRVDEGLARFDRALAINPRYAQAHEHRGRALRALGRMEEAAAAYRESLRLRPDSVTARAGLAYALLEQSDLDGATREARAALALDARSADAHLVLGTVLLLQGNAAGASEAFGRAVSADPSSADARANLAGALIRQERFAEAEAACREALLRAPDHAGAHTNLGLALWRQGRTEEARAQFAEVLRLNPRDALARRYVEQIEASR